MKNIHLELKIRYIEFYIYVINRLKKLNQDEIRLIE